MKNKFRITIFSALLFALSGFNSANAITADELLALVDAWATTVNQAFDTAEQRLNDHDSRISDLENANPNLGGYSMAFSDDGAPTNVVVFSRDDGNGWTSYTVRSRYATSVGQISINGELTQRPFIANYAYAQVDDLGNLVEVTNYIEAPDTSDYVVYNVEETQYDPVSLAKTVTDDTLREDWNVCNYGQTTICIPEVSLSQTGEHVNWYTWSSIRGVAGPITVNGMTFDDVRLEQNIGATDQGRVRAQGIGEILRVNHDGNWERGVIFYRANGVTGGSLAGTPFAPGEPLDGFFF